ncbi:MAG: arsenite methyltransferase [Armatimonadetes bacterium]|nr:arsenite methyltransferase [Armatimonadota bacterium]
MSEQIKQAVQEAYGKIAREGGSCCGDGSPLLQLTSRREDVAKGIGYDEDDLAAAPEGANLGLGCGNPTAIASLKPGDTVLDLGSGGGFDCFLASRQVGPEGKVIGVDMTDEMLLKARENAAKGGFANVEFRKGDIEALPVESGSVDVIISNCVLNLVPDKRKAFAEMFRVLRPGGRIAVSDIVLDGELSQAVLDNMAAYTACAAGAIRKEIYRDWLEESGFREVAFPSLQDASSLLACAADDTTQRMLAGVPVESLRGIVLSAQIAAWK